VENTKPCNPGNSANKPNNPAENQEIIYQDVYVMQIKTDEALLRKLWLERQINHLELKISEMKQELEQIEKRQELRAAHEAEQSDTAFEPNPNQSDAVAYSEGFLAGLQHARAEMENRS
jgi:TolA-binding protein